MRNSHLAGACALIAAFGLGGAARAATATTAGAASMEAPTLISLGMDWRIEGDDNRNAKVEVAYRRKGDVAWTQAQPLLRLQHEDVNASGGSNAQPRANGTMLARPPLYYKVPNMFSGSVFDLTPGTDYEVRLILTDPDGVSGARVKVLTARTRTEPQPAAGGRVFHVYPWDYKGVKQQPAYTGLMAAYYAEARHADWANASPPRVQAGDTILVHAGVYKDVPYHYGDGVEGQTEPRLATEFDGTYYLTESGTADKPIVIKGAGDGEAIFDGNGNHNLFNLMGGNYNYFEGFTVRNTEIAFLVGVKRIAGSSGFTLKHSKIENVGRGVQADWSGSKNFYIADNVFIGRHDPDRMLGWTEQVWSKFPGFPEKISGPGGSEYAVKVYGQGHVVAYNHLERWHDGIDVATYGDPDGAPDGIEDRMPVSIDFYNNDFTNMADNCIEGDGGARNIRVFRNLCFNAAGGAFSAQTIFGGPLYFFRNVFYSGVGGALKFSITPTGIINFNNTYVADSGNTGLASNAHFRNNLFLSHAPQGQAFGVATFTNYSTSDYNGFRAEPTVSEPFSWNSPDKAKAAEYAMAPVARRFKSLADYAAATSQDTHSVMVDYDVFQKVAKPDAATPQRLYNPADYDFRLRPGSAAIDKGVALANITDGFAGAAPDLGAIEAGAEVPHYGPRP